VHFVAAEAAADDDDDELAEEEDLATLRCADAAQPHVWQKFTVPLPAAASVNPCAGAGSLLRKRFNTGRTALPLLWNLIILLVSEATGCRNYDSYEVVRVCTIFFFVDKVQQYLNPSLSSSTNQRRGSPLKLLRHNPRSRR